MMSNTHLTTLTTLTTRTTWITLTILVLSFAFLTSCSSSKYSFSDADDGKLADSFPMEKAIVVNPDQHWYPFPARQNRANCYWREYDNAIPTFFIGQPNKRYLWNYYPTRPINFSRYPIIVLQYRALNTPLNSEDYLFWFNSTTVNNRGRFDIISLKEIKPDGKLHEIRKDIRTIVPFGEITCISIGVTCNNSAPASFQLVALRFEADPYDAPLPPYTDAKTYNVKVVDSSGSPIPDALVTLDAEHPNFARRSTTDENGLTSLTAISNNWQRHMFRVTKPGMAIAELHSTDTCKQDPIVFTLEPLATYSGHVLDEQGNGIANVVIELSPDGRRSHQSYGYKTPYTIPPYRLITDDQGKWQTQLTENYSTVLLRQFHPDFPVSKFFRVPPAVYPNASAQAMRDGKATSILKK